MLHQTFTLIINFFPLFSQVTAQLMHWGIAVFGGVAVLCTITYFLNGRRQYRGSMVFVEREIILLVLLALEALLLA